jgi:hypothetical protein
LVNGRKQKFKLPDLLLVSEELRKLVSRQI